MALASPQRTKIGALDVIDFPSEDGAPIILDFQGAHRIGRMP